MKKTQFQTIYATFLVILLLFPLAIVQAGGLNTIYNLVGEEDWEAYGFPVEFIGDINNDTYPDFAVSAGNNSFGGVEEAGKVHIYSGQTGAEIRVHGGAIPHGFFGSAISAIGDINGDNYADYAIQDPRYTSGGIYEAGRVVAYSGQTGAALWTYVGTSQRQFLWGNSQMAPAGDLNGDSIPDLLAGAPGMDPNRFDNVPFPGAILVLSGVNGTVINQYAYTGTNRWEQYGMSLDGNFDLNGDGIKDALIGDPLYFDGVYFRRGRIFILSGSDFSTVLLSVTGPAAEEDAQFGVTVSWSNDMNGDGKPDLIIGSRESIGAIASAGAIYAYSGNTGAQIYKASGTDSYGYFGQSVSRLGDVNNDGYPDFTGSSTMVTGQGQPAAGRAEVWSGKNGVKWTQIGGGAVDEMFGSDISGGVDVNKDGYPDAIFGAIGGKFGSLVPGRARVMVGNPAYAIGGSDVEVYPNSTTRITFSTVTTSGDTPSTYNSATPNFRTRQGPNQEVWQITTAAIFSGNIVVCLKYNPATYGNISLLQIQHFESGSWVNKTTSNDTVNYWICGTVTSL